MLWDFVRPRAAHCVAVVAIAGLASAACARPAQQAGAAGRPRFATALKQLNDGPCAPGQTYQQEDLQEPTRILPADRQIHTELIVRIRERCVPVWVPSADSSTGSWQMQTLKLRTYGFPKDPNRPITEADADDPASPNIAWSAPGPTFIVHPATSPGAPDGTRIKIRLYNRMPYVAEDAACVPNEKCNTSGPNAGLDANGRCKQPVTLADGGFPAQTPAQTVNGKVVEPPNCFHGLNSTNLHFHGFHVSPQPGQDDVGLEVRPPLPPGAPAPAHGTHGALEPLVYGQYDYNIDPLRYTQPPGTHWYHAHKHGSTALQVLNGQVGTFEVRGEFDRKLEDYFTQKGGGALVERLMVVQQLQENLTGLGGADQTGAVLINGQGNPRVHMKPGEIQRWRFVGATMQAAAALRIGFPDVAGKTSPEIRQIAMDGVQFSPDNFKCQPFLNNPDCTTEPDTSLFNELTDFKLSPGNRVDVLVKAPATPGEHCMVMEVTSTLGPNSRVLTGLAARAEATKSTCGISRGLGPLFTLVVDNSAAKEMKFPDGGDYPALPAYLADIPAVTNPAKQRTVFYEMVGQTTLTMPAPGAGNGSQFWIDQAKYDPACANETVTMDEPEQWTLRNNSFGVAHPFHIHQNPFQLMSQTALVNLIIDGKTEKVRVNQVFKYPVWRDTLAIPTAFKPANPSNGFAAEPNSNPDALGAEWGSAVLRYVAKEFTGGFVHHCHILGHEDRGMMQNTQAVCPSGQIATTGPVAPGARCDANGFCPSDCVTGQPAPAMAACPAPPAQQSNWPAAFGYPSRATGATPAASPAPRPGSGMGGGGGMGGGTGRGRGTGGGNRGGVR